MTSTSTSRSTRGYLEHSETLVSLANRKDTAVFFAVEGIVAVHEDRGEAAEAVSVLSTRLEKYPDKLAVRNIIRFKLRDLCREAGQGRRALAQLDAAIVENR